VLVLARWCHQDDELVPPLLQVASVGTRLVEVFGEGASLGHAERVGGGADASNPYLFAECVRLQPHGVDFAAVAVLPELIGGLQGTVPPEQGRKHEACQFDQSGGTLQRAQKLSQTIRQRPTDSSAHPGTRTATSL
jgi:hypothetical protein